MQCFGNMKHTSALPAVFAEITKVMSPPDILWESLTGLVAIIQNTVLYLPDFAWSFTFLHPKWNFFNHYDTVINCVFSLWYVEVTKMTNHSGLWDVEFFWDFPIDTRLICHHGLKPVFWIHGLSVLDLAWFSRFLQPRGNFFNYLIILYKWTAFSPIVCEMFLLLPQHYDIVQLIKYKFPN